METKLSTIIGLAVTALFITVTLAILFVPLRNSELAHLLVGDLIGIMSLLVGYYWGSSQGSKDKQKTINNLTSNDNSDNTL